jgi:hypothetical protein
VGEPDPAVAIERHETVIDRRLEVAGRDKLRRRARQRRALEERVPGRLGQTVEASEHEPNDGLWDGDADVGRVLPASEGCPRDLEGHDRVATGGCLDPTEVVARQCDAELLVDHLGEACVRQRTQAEPIDRGSEVDRPDCRIECRRHSNGSQKARAEVAQPAESKGDNTEGRQIEPLEIVDCDDHGRVGGQASQQRQEAGRGREAADRLARFRVDPGEGDLERPTLWFWQVHEQVEVPTEQVEQPRERKLGLGLDGLRGEDSVLAGNSACADLRPDGGLADPGLTLEDERRGPCVERTEEPVAGG